MVDKINLADRITVWTAISKYHQSHTIKDACEVFRVLFHCVLNEKAAKTPVDNELYDFIYWHQIGTIDCFKLAQQLAVDDEDLNSTVIYQTVKPSEIEKIDYQLKTNNQNTIYLHACSTSEIQKEIDILSDMSINAVFVYNYGTEFKDLNAWLDYMNEQLELIMSCKEVIQKDNDLKITSLIQRIQTIIHDKNSLNEIKLNELEMEDLGQLKKLITEKLKTTTNDDIQTFKLRLALNNIKNQRYNIPLHDFSLNEDNTLKH